MAAFNIIKNQQNEIRIFHRRLFITIIFIGILSALLIFRLCYLQIIQHKLYSTLSEQNHLLLLPLEPKRGLIYDRNGVLLAENIPIFSLDVLPDQIDAFEDNLGDLQKIISITDENLEQFYRIYDKQRHLEPIPLKFNLSEEEVAKFYLNQYRFPGLTVSARLIRHYPFGESMVSALGYVGRINAQELKTIDTTNYAGNTFIGKIGIEKFYEKELHGQVGYQQVEKDAGGRTIRILNRLPPKSGDNIHLTIDSGLQEIAKNALGAERGAIVAIQPENGEVLVLVSNPSYDPNLFVTGISKKAFQALQGSPDKPLYNRAIRGQSPPGSTIKPYLALKGLDSEIIDAEYTINDPGWFKLPNSRHLYRDWAHKGHDKVNLTKAIIVSCDTYFYNLATLLGIDSIDDILQRFGFGQKTGIDSLEELPGNLPSPKWKMKKFHTSWYPGDTVISGIGQGFMLVTPLQLADSVATIANRGLRFKPHLLAKIQAEDNAIFKPFPVATNPVILKDAKNWDIVIKAMQGVIDSKDPWGTGRIRFGFDPAYSVAAKTGTAQLYRHYINENQTAEEAKIAKHLRNNSLFIAFAPVEKPKIAIAVIVENSMIAGSVARKVMDYYFFGPEKKDAKRLH